MVETLITLGGWIVLVIGGVLLGRLIRTPPTATPPRLLIALVLMPVGEMLLGLSILMRPYTTAQSVILPLVGCILAVVVLVIRIQYRPTAAESDGRARQSPNR